MKLLDLFRSGKDTMQIAALLKITEARAYNRLQIELQREFDARNGIDHARKSRWPEKHTEKRKMERRLRKLVPYVGAEV